MADCDYMAVESCQPAPEVAPEQGGFRTRFWSAPGRSMWMSRSGWVVSQTRVCDTGPQFSPFSLFGCGSRRYSAKRTSRPRVSEVSGSDPETQRQQLLASGVALPYIYQDVGVSGTSGTNSRRGWHSPDSRLAQGDTLAVVSINDLQRRGVRVCSLADNEQSWAQYLDADPDSPESFLGYTLAGFAAWVSDQELGVHPPLYQGGFGEGEGGRQETGRSSPVVRGAGDRDHRNGGHRSQPAARCQGLRPIACCSASTCILTLVWDNPGTGFVPSAADRSQQGHDRPKSSDGRRTWSGPGRDGTAGS